MRKLFFLLVLLYSVNTFSQIYAQPAPVRRPMPDLDTATKIYVGGGSGIEYFSGAMGVIAGYKITDNLMIRAGAGLGGWGTKLSGGILYYFKKDNSWGLGLSYTSSSGRNNYTTSMEVFNDSGRVVTIPVNIVLSRASTVNLTSSYRWVLKKKKELCIEGGYSIPIETEPYHVLGNYRLTDKSKAVLRLLQPGGFHLSLGICLLFGLR